MGFLDPPRGGERRGVFRIFSRISTVSPHLTPARGVGVDDPNFVDVDVSISLIISNVQTGRIVQETGGKLFRED